MPATQSLETEKLSPPLKVAAGQPLEATSISQLGASMTTLELASKPGLAVALSAKRQTLFELAAPAVPRLAVAFALTVVEAIFTILMTAVGTARVPFT